MVPNNTFTTTPDIGVIQPPYDIPHEGLLSKSRGGIALNDPSQGRDYQTWIILYENGNINVGPEGQAYQLQLPATDVLNVSLGFDGNMAPVIGFKQSTGCKLYFYDNSLSQYTYLNLNGATSCAVVLDDKRQTFLAQSDVLFFYTFAGTLYWRQQRDHYAIAYTIGPSGTNRIYRAGMTNKNRIQVELK